MSRFNAVYHHEKYQKLLCILSELEKDRVFCRHHLQHFLDVARIMYILNHENDYHISKDIIYAAALLHDIGRVMQYKDGTPHHLASIETAKEILPECGYDGRETKEIVNAILSHRNKCDDNNKTVLAKLLYQADKLSRLCFDCNAEDECYWDKDKKNRDINW